MTRIRRDIWGLQTDADGWSETLLWYAKAVIALQERPIADKTSWRYLAAMHGINEDIWRQFGIIRDDETMPDEQEQRLYWRQCQHQTWFFPPWHRGYLASFEQIIRKAIVDLGGPEDWALPYWNYNNQDYPTSRTLPTCFYEPKMPDGTTDNPLHVIKRYGDDGNGQFVLNDEDIDLLPAMKESDFFGTDPGVSPGFGGVRTRFSHYGRDNGLLESNPHNNVHGIVGGFIPGTDPRNPVNSGLMARPTTAALDPVFWLHHSNIDRLWEVWLARAPGVHSNPIDEPAWMEGTPLDNRGFIVPDAEGNGYYFEPKDMLDTTAAHLDYSYEDLRDPLGGASRLESRVMRMNLDRLPAAALLGDAAMRKKKVVEMMGASEEGNIRLDSDVSTLRVRLDRPTALKAKRSFDRSMLMTESFSEPDRIFLNLENIRGANDALVLYVYVALNHGADIEHDPELCVGSVSLFGVSDASLVDEHHGGNGISAVLEITDVYDRLGGEAGLDSDHLKVRIAARNQITPADDISIGRISLYRQQG